MIRQIIILLTLLVVIGSCKAQDNSSNNIKKNKNMERTTEKFDSWKYYTHRENDDYEFNSYLKGKVRQFGGENGSNYFEYAKKDKELFGTYREYYNKSKTLKLIGKYYYNDFESGIWKEYDENGYLIAEYDQDAPYKNYPWEKVEKFVKPQFRSIILCDLLLYIDVTFWYLSIDLGLFWGSWFLHRHKIPHPNPMGDMIATKKYCYSRNTSE